MRVDKKIIAVSVVITVLNEEKTVEALLYALNQQTYKPKEILIVDGGSADTTVKKLTHFKQGNKQLPLKILQKPGNRSVGRNYGIRQAKSSWIAITDAGCVPEPSWLAALIECQHQSQAQVIAGYYRAEPRTAFEEAMVPYALVMPDRVDESNFLPATRSMLLHKKIWDQQGGFNEMLSDNEDFVFAKQLQTSGIEMSFARQAVVVWQPRSSWKAFVTMIYRFARGDTQAGIIRPKVLIIYLRYLIASWILFAALGSSSTVLFVTILLGALTYGLWAIEKNYRYAKNGWYWLPVLQISSDMAVMLGSLAGFWRATAVQR